MLLAVGQTTQYAGLRRLVDFLHPTQFLQEPCGFAAAEVTTSPHGADQLTRASKSKALDCTFVCFHLGHDYYSPSEVVLGDASTGSAASAGTGAGASAGTLASLGGLAARGFGVAATGATGVFGTAATGATATSTEVAASTCVGATASAGTTTSLGGLAGRGVGFAVAGAAG